MIFSKFCICCHHFFPSCLNSFLLNFSSSSIKTWWYIMSYIFIFKCCNLVDISTIITSVSTGELYLGFVFSLIKIEVSSRKNSFLILNNSEWKGMLIFLFFKYNITLSNFHMFFFNIMLLKFVTYCQVNLCQPLHNTCFILYFFS